MKKYKILLMLLLQLVPVSISAQQTNQDINAELLVAARKSDVEAVKLLLTKGANVNATTEYGATPLIYACDRGNAEVVRILLEHGADANFKDKFYNWTPLVWAVARDHAEVVKLLLGKVPQGKEMVMEIAVGEGKLAVTKMLLEMGGFNADTLTTYLTMAEKNMQTETAAILTKAGAKPRPKFNNKIDAESLKIYEGIFKNEEVEINFKVKEGKLVNSQSGRAYIPTDIHTFEPEGQPQVSVIFKFDGNKAINLALKFPRGEMILKRVEAQ